MSRKTDIHQRLKEISNQLEPLEMERDKLLRELRDIKIKDMVDSGVLGEVKWKFSLNQHGVVHLSGPHNYEPKDLFKPAQWDHDSFDIGKVTVHYSDGECFLLFDTVKSFKGYRDKWNLNVDYSNLDNELTKARVTFDELTTLKEDL